VTAEEWRRFAEVGGFRQFERRQPVPDQEPHREGWLPNAVPERDIEAVPKMTWKIWGSERDSLFEGTEEEVKDKYAAEYVEREDLFIEDPDGNEYIWDVTAKEWRHLQ
jgi:hypothetical protein